MSGFGGEKGANLPVKSGELLGKSGKLPGTSGLLLSSTVRELRGSRRKTSGKFGELPGKSPKLSRNAMMSTLSGILSPFDVATCLRGLEIFGVAVQLQG